MELAKGINIVRITIKPNCSNIINKKYYEPLICKLMNDSSMFFPNKPIMMNDFQSNGESDFYDAKNNKYEVKLLLDKKQGKMLGRNVDKDVIGFFDEIKAELQEFGNHLSNNEFFDIEDSQFYKIVNERVKSVKDDENILLFIPFPIFPDSKELSVFNRFTDFAQKVYDKLLENDVIRCRDFYYIYPSQDGDTCVIRQPDTRHKEFVYTEDFQNYYVFERVN